MDFAIPRCNIVFDTNFFFHCDSKRGVIPLLKRNELIAQIQSHGFKVFGSAVTLMEMMVHFTQNKQHEFEWRRRVLEIFLDTVGDNVLEAPDTFLREYFKMPSRGKSLSAQGWLNGARRLVKAECYAQLREEDKYPEQFTLDYRNAIHTGFLSGIKARLTNYFPNYENDVLTGKRCRMSSSQRSRVEADIQASGVYLATDIAERAGITEVLTPQLTAQIEQDFEAYRDAWFNLMRRLLFDGPNLQNCVNDYNDIHQLFYLAHADVAMLTGEKTLPQKYMKDSIHRHRVIYTGDIGLLGGLLNDA